MANAMTTSVARQIESLFAGGSIAGLSDRQLVDRFVTGRDTPAAEAAFAALVARHGPMVLNVCRQLLGDHQHAEDAFQAIFLVLARRARSIRDPDLLGPWLYGVALRTARKARARLARIRKGERDGAAQRPEAIATDPADRSLIERERAEALHAEIDRLPASARLPVVLCYLEGLSLAEAAERLRCPAGTVHSRLDRAKEKLRRGLLRRGIVLSTTALGAALAPRPASTSIPPLLCDSTARAAIAFAARRATGGALSATAAALAQEVARTMLIHKLKATTLFLLFMATVGAVVVRASRPHAAGAGGTPAPQGRPAAIDDAPRPAPGRMFIAGRVLDPDGKPVSGAVVDVVTRFRSPVVGTDDDTKPWLTLLGQGRSDGDGRFRLDAPRTASTRVYQVSAVAVAPGYGLGWAVLNPDAEEPTAEIRLLPEHTYRIRLVDVTGAPAKGVEVQVLRVGRRTSDSLVDGVGTSGNPPVGMLAWPRPVTTDDQGRITLTGLGRGRGITIDLSVFDPRYARQNLEIDAAQPGDQELSLALQPAKVIEGRVLAADTGQPIPNAVISIGAGGGPVRGFRPSRFRADDQGRFTANPHAGESFRVNAHAPEGQPYLVPQVEFTWTKAAVKKTLDIALPHGVLIRGKVTEAGTNRPLPDSSVYFLPMGNVQDVLSGWEAGVASQADGSFAIAVPPGKGHLVVYGPTDDYILEEIGSNMLNNGRAGGMRYRVHAVIPYEVKAGDPPREVAAALRPGATLRGHIEGPDGQAVADASILTRLYAGPTRPTWLANGQIKVRDGRFKLHGLDPQGSTRISILDPEHEWGATLDVSGKQAGQDLTIRLQPCGRARARFVGPDGKPITNPSPPLYEFVATPGPSIYSRRKGAEQAALTADADFLSNVDRRHYWDDPVPDAEGRVTLVALIPGALYRITDFSTVNQEKGAQVRKDFTVKPGETLDLGDILIERPPS